MQSAPLRGKKLFLLQVKKKHECMPEVMKS